MANKHHHGRVFVGETGGQPLVTTGTFISAVLAILTFYLPKILTAFGVPLASQGALIVDINQLGPPLFSILTILFRHNATRKVTSILPNKTARAVTLRVVPFLMIMPILVIAGLGTLGLAACATLSGNTQVALLVPEIAGETSYIALAEGVKIYDGLPTTSAAGAAKANADWEKGWLLLGQVRSAYGLGQTFLPILIELSDLQSQTSSDTAGKVTAVGPRTETMKSAMKSHRVGLSVTDISLAITILEDILSVGTNLIQDLPQLFAIIQGVISASGSGNLTALQAQQTQVQAIANGLQPPAATSAPF